MKIALIVLGAFAALVIVVVAAGMALPVEHRAVREARYERPSAEIFALIADPKKFPSWRSSVESVEILPDSNGRRRYREVGSDGAILYEVEESVPNERLVTRIADRSLPFGGRWTFELIPSGGSTIVRITEDGEVYNPVFRFLSRFVIGHTRGLDTYLRDLARQLGETGELVIASGWLAIAGFPAEGVRSVRL
ncbi:MAG TPA: SRPBCC family protein [Gemmatimonadaceae bacterium]|nr:SRPBCC family protein [Gemmatimonadaceae bacterium]